MTTPNSRPMTGRAEGEPTEPGWYWAKLEGDEWHPVAAVQAEYEDRVEMLFGIDEPIVAWGPRIPIPDKPPSDPSAGEGPPLRVLEEAIADGRSEVTRDNAEIAALRDRVRALEAAGHRLLIVLTPAFVGTDARSDTVADFRRALTSGAPKPGEGGEL